MELADYLGTLRGMRPDDLRSVAASLTGESVADEVDWWRATIAIDRALRYERCTRQAGQAAAEAAQAVEDAATRGGAPMPDAEVRRVGRAAAEIARGIVAGPAAAPLVRLLLERWEPFTARV